VQRSGASIEIPLSRGGEPIERPEYPVPRLHNGASVSFGLNPPTGRRGVVVVGPIRTVRGDPLGMLRRKLALAQPVELIVTPETTPIGKIGAGLLRDLEGQATNDRSVSDVACHSLREYVTGDNLRHVHAFTSARFGRPMVRQFVDTRTARLSIMVSGSPEDCPQESEFEDALSIAGSFAVRGVDDEQTVAVLAAGQHTAARSRQSRRMVLDALARARHGEGPDLLATAERMKRLAPDTSIAVLVTGTGTGLVAMQRAAKLFGPDVRAVAVRVDASVSPDVAQARRLLMVTVPSLEAFGTMFAKGLP
jgi:uncharacterized protein (DUF58 family)